MFAKVFEFVLDCGGVERDAPAELRKRFAAFHLRFHSRGLVGADSYRFESLHEAAELARAYDFLLSDKTALQKQGVFDSESGFFVGYLYHGKWDGKHHG